MDGIHIHKAYSQGLKMQSTFAQEEFNFSEYAILGIDPHVAPNKTPPAFLSETAERHWRFLMNDNLQSSLFKMNSLAAWDRILGVMHDWAETNNENYLSQTIFQS